MEVFKIERIMSIGEKIEYKAKEKGMSLRKVAIESGMSYNSLYSFVKNKRNRIDPTTLSKIAKVLGTSTLYFYTEVPAHPADPEDQKIFGRYVKDGKLELPNLMDGKALDAEENKETPDTEVSDEDLKIALFHGASDVTDEMWEEAREYARFIYERERKKREKG